MSQYIGKASHYPSLTTHYHHPLTQTTDPPRLLPRLAPRRPLHRPTTPRSTSQPDRPGTNGQTQTHLRPQHGLRRLHRGRGLQRRARHGQEDAAEEVLLPQHAAGLAEGDDDGTDAGEVGRRRVVEAGGTGHAAEESAEG